MRVSIVGTGYVGLVTGACLAERGHSVTCVDVDAAKIEAITRGEAPFFEPGLDALLRRHAGRELRATTDLAAAVIDSEITLVATGTPFDGRHIDLSAVESAARAIGTALRAKDAYHVVAVKSTVVPGTTDGVVLPLLESASGKRAGTDFGLGMNPEFLSEGSALADFREPDRIVLGGIDPQTVATLEALYASFDGVPFFRTDNATAELTKYASNALLATMISFSNEIADLAAALPGVDVVDVLRGVHAMRELSLPGLGRAGMTRFLHPGCGFGGSCLPKDVKALSAWAGARGRRTPLLDAALRVNRDRPRRTLGLIERELGTLEGKAIAVLGLAFKPGTDDVRESPAFPLIDLLVGRGANVRAFDPVARESARRALGGLAGVVCDTLPDAIHGAAAVVVLTAWDEFRTLPPLLRTLDPTPLLVDGRRMFDPHEYARYVGIGRGRRRTDATAHRGYRAPDRASLALTRTRGAARPRIRVKVALEPTEGSR